MAVNVVHLPDPIDPWNALWASFERGMRADSNITSRRTLEIYGEAGRQFHEFQVERHSAVDPVEIEKQHVENWLIYLREERQAKPATIRARFSALRRFFNWCVAEEEITHSPMTRMRAPDVDEPSPDVLTDAEAKSLLATCEGKDFEARRDMAIVRLMLDTGLRRFEVAAMTLADIKAQIDTHLISVVGKGSRTESVYFGDKTARDLDRYLRVRVLHPRAALPGLWLAQKGALTGDGIHDLITRRAKEAGIRHIHPHLLRHTWADAFKSGGASDEDVMTLGRWKDPKIMRRYAKSRATARAVETARRIGTLGDRL
jgi:site-specific recombinase XerD